MNRAIGQLLRIQALVDSGQILARSMSTMNPVETSIREKLSLELQPVHLDVMNESYMHNVPKGSESHFKVVVVSEKFTGLPLIKRHRLVNHVLQEELEKTVHALSITAKTPEQWENSNQTVHKSPPCRGGAGK
ncbi:bolA-like protein DDB_G0274169 [Lineus longissimus]|uniref:bolA-like protein DDB_G0274169 n=1 Tax=Lineus longissimus TaxID=88925 RepID=UPI002B4CB02B